MPEDLNLRLAALRAEHLTATALLQFKEVANEYKQDGYPNYDLLVDYFDFDRLWFPSMQFTQLGESSYQVCYTRGKVVRAIILKIIRLDKEYRIDGISNPTNCFSQL
ncbi:MAG: hypothetical protein LBO71_00310 [Prevotellaceae bacterium]|jgi:hypothetical protein|nr:hypothetical protein [Prevotellaceae bacterium]